MALSPGWALNYVPTVAEWNTWWASKLDVITFPSVVSVKDAGAIGDGTTDDTQAFRRAVAALHNGRGVVLVPSPSVSYRLSGTIVLPANVSVVGDEHGTPITTAAGVYTLFSITGSFVTVKNFFIQNTSKTGGVDVSIDIGSNPNGLHHIIVENLRTIGSYGIVADSGNGLALYQDCVVRNIWGEAVRGIGLFFTRFFGSLFVYSCTISYGGSTDANHSGIAIDTSPINSFGAVGGLWMKDCSCSQGANGYSIANTIAVWADNCEADSNSSFGFLISGVQNAYLSQLKSGGSGNTGVWFVNTINTTVTAPVITGGGGSGLVFASNNAFISVVNPYIYACPINGIEVSATQLGAINITGGIFQGNGRYGLACFGGSAVMASKMTFVANVSANYSLGGSLHHIRSAMVNSGAAVDVDGPATG